MSSVLNLTKNQFDPFRHLAISVTHANMLYSLANPQDKPSHCHDQMKMLI